MKTLLKSVLLMLCCFEGVTANAADSTPDTQWTYKTINGKELMMDVFLPEGYASAKKNFPLIVFYHGGGWSGGKVSWHHPDCAYWSKRGMIAVSVDYRLRDRDQVEVPLECVKDAKSAVRFLRKNAEELKIDVDKVVVAGASAGGQMAAAVAMIDNVNDQNDDLAISCKPTAVVLYNPYYKCEDELSPPNFVVEGLPPMISFLGSEDPSIMVESLKAVHKDLIKAGNVSEFYVGQGGKHGFCIGIREQNRFFYWSLELVDAFLVKHGVLTGENQVIRPAGVVPLKPEEIEAYPPSEIQINFRSPLSVWLKITEVSKTLSEANTPIRGGYFPWTGNASLRWEVEVPATDDYEIYLTANVSEAGDRKKITIAAGGKQADVTILKTSGPFPGGENFKIKEALNFERKKLSGTLPLEAGKQIITVSTSGIETEEALFHIRGLELLPVSKKALIAAEEARAISARASFDWMAETGYGLMFHWTSRTPQRDGSRLSYEEAVNDFDVEEFVNMVAETGAGYVIFPIGHAESYCPAPIESWERVHPGQTTQRDLIEELADALNERNIRLICYINGPLAFNYPKRVAITPEIVEAFVANFKAILPEIGMHYKDKIAGYWFDTMILKIPFEDFFNAAKVGNKDRLICLNAFYWQEASPWQDYWAGEVQHPIAPPVNGYMKNGISPNLPYHVLLTMEKFSWGVGRGGEIKDPKFTSEELSSYIKACMENGGAITVNMGIYQDGTVGEKALEVMQGVKSEIRK